MWPVSKVTDGEARPVGSTWTLQEEKSTGAERRWERRLAFDWNTAWVWGMEEPVSVPSAGSGLPRQPPASHTSLTHFQGTVCISEPPTLSLCYVRSL